MILLSGWVLEWQFYLVHIVENLLILYVQRKKNISNFYKYLAALISQIQHKKKYLRLLHLLGIRMARHNTIDICQELFPFCCDKPPEFIPCTHFQHHYLPVLYLQWQWQLSELCIWLASLKANLSVLLPRHPFRVRGGNSTNNCWITRTSFQLLPWLSKLGKRTKHDSHSHPQYSSGHLETWTFLMQFYRCKIPVAINTSSCRKTIWWAVHVKHIYSSFKYVPCLKLCGQQDKFK